MVAAFGVVTNSEKTTACRSLGSAESAKQCQNRSPGRREQIYYPIGRASQEVRSRFP